MRGRFGDLTNLEEISARLLGRPRMAAWRVLRRQPHRDDSRPGPPQLLTRDCAAVPKATDVIFMLDISPSMFARDMDPNRLGRAQQIIQQFILHKLPDDRYALVAFQLQRRHPFLSDARTTDHPGVLRLSEPHDRAGGRHQHGRRAGQRAARHRRRRSRSPRRTAAGAASWC